MRKLAVLFTVFLFAFCTSDSLAREREFVGTITKIDIQNSSFIVKNRATLTNFFIRVRPFTTFEIKNTGIGTPKQNSKATFSDLKRRDKVKITLKPNTLYEYIAENVEIERK